MSKLTATAREIKKAIIEHVSVQGNLAPSEIFTSMIDSFPNNNHYEIRYIVKEMQKENLLVNDIIFGGLRVQ